MEDTELKEEGLVEEIHNLIEQIYRGREEKEFIPGKSKVHYSGPVFDENEVNAVINSLLGEWLAEGEKTVEFEREFSRLVGVKDSIVVNSGSNALLLTLATLMSPGLKKPFKVGDEVLTSALTFPTSLNAIILNGLKPVFVDVERETYNLDVDLIEDMITDKTKAILAVHHLGNPCKMDRIMEISKENDLKVIEDCCDAHGTIYKGKTVGSYGDMGTFSFYGAHAMTMGEGGLVTTNNPVYTPILISLKTCGRACVCRTCTLSIDSEEECPIRFQANVEGFEEYDKRTLYPYIGYKMKILDLQCAFGLEQLKKLPDFVQKRSDNFRYIVNSLKPFEDYLELPAETKGSKMVSWFSVPITVRKDAPFSRKEIVDYLEKSRIETRPLLGGNLLKQPAYRNLEYRATSLDNTNFFHDNSFYVGCFPGITSEMRGYIVSVFAGFFKNLS